MTVREEILKELYKPARRHFPRRKVVMRGFFETMGIDLAEFIPYARENRGYKYILCAIDHFSKFAFAEPLKNKSGPEVAIAMKRILSKCPAKVINVHSDQGKEFYNSHFKKVMDEDHINHYNTYTHIKNAICERFIRTLKGKLWFTFALRGNHKWTDVLQDVMKKYNQTTHRTIKMAPCEVNEQNAPTLLKTVYKDSSLTTSKQLKFNVGDHVRMSREKQLFEKGYTANFTTEIFQITSVSATNPPVYKLKDWEGKEIAGAFYAEELQKTKYPDTYLVEKVLKKDKDKAKVKWLNFPSEYNSWIERNDIV